MRIPLHVAPHPRVALTVFPLGKTCRSKRSGGLATTGVPRAPLWRGLPASSSPGLIVPGPASDHAEACGKTEAPGAPPW